MSENFVYPKRITEEMINLAKVDSSWHFAENLNSMLQFGYCKECGLIPQSCKCKNEKNFRNKTILETNYYSFEDYILVEELKDTKITKQYFQTKDPSKSHPYSYENKSMKFFYYKDIINKLNNLTLNFCSDEFFDWLSEPDTINPKSFNDWENVVCIWSGMDGHLWKINDKYPIPGLIHQNYIGGFTDKYFDLNKVKSTLEKFSWVSNVEIIDIPYYNRDSGNQAVEFDYKAPIEMIKEIYSKNQSGMFFEDHFGGVYLKEGINPFNLEKN